MQVKTFPPMKVMFFTTKTTLEELEQYVYQVAEKLYADICRLQLIPAGPQFWTYIGMDGNPATTFTLEIAVPVSKKPRLQPVFQFKEVPAFTCATAVHYGSWDELGKTYAAIMPSLLQQQQLTGFTREIYLNIDFDNPANNITEIQIGIN
ncbi:GyrI-like domain-containing protein [Panacibacter sp. DH6]|uniref:GyrI-like domain-containing protein n=1 Tax=Panacibacter microcysteis TaxID=2793269 RepID=A0A931E506_9BACT|nr:GyrI-like domain-containing protein [Panacibacter microcysteis]MBG9375259.1 GyrI-like domain-containing protein [Panacibacter microcysteis]